MEWSGMLVLRDIRKTYPVGEGETVQALRGVDLTLRRSEFVAVLGPSGCGKTTLLNIIGGLDRYSAGDLVIDGVSTKEYTERDWDGYRNHSTYNSTLCRCRFDTTRSFYWRNYIEFHNRGFLIWNYIIIIGN